MLFFWHPRRSGRNPSRTAGKWPEGIIDLGFFKQKANEVFILDWKTNRIAPEKVDNLKEIYRPQMAAYWQAISSLTNALVTTAIYCTAIGQLLIYDADELLSEWQRLARETTTALR